MRRIPLLVAGVLALALAVPAAASAHGHHHRHHHKAKAHHARVRHFGGHASASDPGVPDAGTVTSFADGTLTLTLADGSTVSGKVTADTEIDCVPAGTTPSPTAAAAHDGSWGDGGGQSGDRGDDQSGDDQSGDDEGDHGHCSGASACTASDLVPGAVVHEALLKIGADGAEFELVVLVKQAAS
jgi:hypothetical protein